MKLLLEITLSFSSKEAIRDYSLIYTLRYSWRMVIIFICDTHYNTILKDSLNIETNFSRIDFKSSLHYWVNSWQDSHFCRITDKICDTFLLLYINNLIDDYVFLCFQNSLPSNMRLNGVKFVLRVMSIERFLKNSFLRMKSIRNSNCCL
jgi:hypothetical protein